METNQDTNRLATIDRKISTGIELSKDDLVFLYEIEKPIKYFGLKRDPRIVELREVRNLREDLPVIFECAPDQIAYKEDEVNENTKVYIGEWSLEVYNKLPSSIQYIYEEFHNKKVFFRDIELDPVIRNAKIAEKTLLEKGYKTSGRVKQIIQKTPFGGEKKSLKLVSFSVGSLGFSNGATIKEIFDKAKELGLELCPAEIGPQMRLQYTDQPMNEYLYLAMEPITDSDGNPSVFLVADGSWLVAGGAYPDDRWHSGIRFVFVSRK